MNERSLDFIPLRLVEQLIYHGVQSSVTCENRKRKSNDDDNNCLNEQDGNSSDCNNSHNNPSNDTDGGNNGSCCAIPINDCYCDDCESGALPPLPQCHAQCTNADAKIIDNSDISNSNDENNKNGTIPPASPTQKRRSTCSTHLPLSPSQKDPPRDSSSSKPKRRKTRKTRNSYGRDDINFQSLPSIVSSAIKKLLKSQYYNATATHPVTGDDYYLHREFYDDVIDLMVQLNERIICLVLDLLKCPTKNSKHSVAGKGTFQSRQDMEKNPSAAVFGAKSDIFAHFGSNVNYGNDCHLFGYNARELCILQEGLRYCKNWTAYDALARMPAIVELILLCIHFKIPCLHLNFCGPKDASKEAMAYINRIESPYFVVVESATHLCTLMRHYQVYKTKVAQMIAITAKVILMDKPVYRFAELVHERKVSLGIGSTLPTISFSRSLMINSKIVYVVADVEQEAKKIAAEKVAEETEKARKKEEKELAAAKKAADTEQKTRVELASLRLKDPTPLNFAPYQHVGSYLEEG